MIRRRPRDGGAGLVELLDVTRRELDRVDQKAELLFTGSGVATGAVIAGTLAGDWSPAGLGTAAGVAWWAGVAAWATALVCLTCAVYPRTAPPARTGTDGRMLAYFADVARLGDPDELRALLPHAAPSRAVVVDQVFRLSKIVHIKYRCLRTACWLLGAGGAGTGLTVLLELG